MATVFVGTIMAFVAFYLPEQVLYGIIGISGATVFYDTIFKAFQKCFENLGEKLNSTRGNDGK